MMAALTGLRAQIQTVGDGTSPGPVQAQHLTVELVAPHMGAEGAQFWSGVIFRLEPGWHVYWVNAGDSGEPPRVQWTLPDGMVADPMLFPIPRRLPLGPLMDFGYEGTAAFPIRVRVTKPAAAGAEQKVHVQAKVDWLVCREVCIPGAAQLGFDYNYGAARMGGAQTSASERVILQAVKNLPKPLPEDARAKVASGKDEFVLTLVMGRSIARAEFYPLDQGQVADATPQRVESQPDGARIHLRRDDTLTHDPASLHGVVKLSDTLGYEVNAPVSNPRGVQVLAAPPVVAAAAVTQPAKNVEVTLQAAIALAFLGGILLNLMPCVFPVLFLKGLALVRGSGVDRRRARMHGVTYTAGIVASFWVIVGVLLALRAGGARLGWGFQLQSPGFVAVLCCGLFFFALSLAGVFDFGLSLTSAGGRLASEHGYAGSFFTGVLATVVATPCTAPLMGAAIGFALAQPTWAAFAVFTAVALGLAMPFLLLSLHPAWTRLLPRPGAWMEVLKQLASVPLFATVIWLAWIYGRLSPTDAGVGAMALLMLALLVIAMAAWTLGRWPARRFAALIAVLLAAGALAIPLTHRENTMLVWQPYSPDALATARAENKAVFIDFTAAWCLSCKVNEAAVLNSDTVQARLRSSGAVLLRADWTKYDAPITAALAEVGRSGVPTYVIYPAGGGKPDVLPELLSKQVVLDALARDVK
jgi:thiol:disulfide interchange protein DsbD